MANQPASERTHRPVMISEAAQRNHEELFPNHRSTLKVTDPELIEVFDNFEFDEVIAHSKLDTKTRVILILGSIIGSHAVSEFKSQIKGHLRGNLNVGNGRDVLLDVITQLLPWVGYPRTVNALSCLNEVAPEVNEVSACRHIGEHET
jgi:4-carboxymuconolactone decarboxylase